MRWVAPTDSDDRERSRATWLAALVPGAGHLYLGLTVRGAFVLLSAVLFAAPIVVLWVGGSSDADLTVLAFVALMLGLTFHLVQIFDARSLSRQARRSGDTTAAWGRRYRIEHDLVFVCTAGMAGAALYKLAGVTWTGVQIHTYRFAVLLWALLLLGASVGIVAERLVADRRAKAAELRSPERRKRRRHRKRRRPNDPPREWLRRMPYRQRKDFDETDS